MIINSVCSETLKNILIRCFGYIPDQDLLNSLYCEVKDLEFVSEEIICDRYLSLLQWFAP